jgi:hypothetical protein
MAIWIQLVFKSKKSKESEENKKREESEENKK